MILQSSAMTVHTSDSPSAALATSDSGLIAFYRDMTGPERRTFWACFGGAALGC